MLTHIHPKLPMRNHGITKNFYTKILEFKTLGDENFEPYLMIQKEGIELHYFLFKDLNPKDNYGQVYIRTDNIAALYKSFLESKIEIHPNGSLQLKPWGQIEFSILDPDNNLLTFGQSVE